MAPPSLSRAKSLHRTPANRETIVSFTTFSLSRTKNLCRTPANRETIIPFTAFSLSLVNTYAKIPRKAVRLCGGFLALLVARNAITSAYLPSAISTSAPHFCLLPPEKAYLHLRSPPVGVGVLDDPQRPLSRRPLVFISTSALHPVGLGAPDDPHALSLADLSSSYRPPLPTRRGRRPDDPPRFSPADLPSGITTSDLSL